MYMNERIAIVGAGAAGMITAAYLTQNGAEVILCDLEEQCWEDFGAISELGIKIKGPGLVSGLRPAVMTHSIAEAMEAECILVCVSSGRQKKTAEWMAPWLRPEHKILLMPGNLGTVIFARVFRTQGKNCSLLAELSECLWACRRLAPGHCISAMPLGEKRIAAFPSEDTPKAMETFGGLLPLKAGANLAEDCLNSPNVLTHLSGTLLNLGGIAQKKEKFALFVDGLNDGYIRCLKLLEEERKEVLKAAGMECYAAPVEPLMAKLRAPQAHPELEAFRQLSGPDGLEHRYITEDAPCGVAFLVSTARRYGVKARVTEALLTLAGSLTGNDYLRDGRTWDWLAEDGADVV